MLHQDQSLNKYHRELQPGTPQLRPTAPEKLPIESPEQVSAPDSTMYTLTAEKTVNLSLKDSFDQSEKNNPEILKAKQDVSLAEAGIISAGAMPNPQLATHSTGFGPAWTKTIAGNTQQVGINQIVETGGKRAARLQLARSQKTTAKLQLDSLRFDLRTRDTTRLCRIGSSSSIRQGNRRPPRSHCKG